MKTKSSEIIIRDIKILRVFSTKFLGIIIDFLYIYIHNSLFKNKFVQ